jgi:hypothetical protein
MMRKWRYESRIVGMGAPTLEIAVVREVLARVLQAVDADEVMLDVGGGAIGRMWFSDF